MLALLHTSPLHVPVFDALRDEDHQGLDLRHFVDEELLARARHEGPEAVADEVRAVLDKAVGEGARAVLCTCSTIGAIAEAAASGAGVPVVRSDRPMAAAAVAMRLADRRPGHRGEHVRSDDGSGRGRGPSRREARPGADPARRRRLDPLRGG